MRILAIIKSRNAAARPEFGAALLAKNNRVDISISLTKLYRIVCICHELTAVSTRKIWTRVFGRLPRVLSLVRHLCRSPTQGLRMKDQREKGTNMLKYKIAIVVLGAAVSASTASIAQESRGTAQQRAACAPDAFRLCASYIPDASRVESCLRLKKSELSGPCRLVFEQNPGAVASTSK